nr:MAG TPA: hypothetical protein [Bacteriophage sp.]DAX05847.1 MAG TPA: hypothetical protein [Caudoviricetes sp.]
MIVCQVLGVESLLRANLLSMDMILFSIQVSS